MRTTSIYWDKDGETRFEDIGIELADSGSRFEMPRHIMAHCVLYEYIDRAKIFLLES